jgi:glycosyltransferase involved in cell wall biosynthesis
MNVLLTHERFLPDFGGGGEYIVFRTATGLLARGVNVRVLTTGDPALRCYQGVPTERLPISRYAFNLQVGPIAAQARAHELIHTFAYHACLPSLLAARRADRPVVCEILGLFGPAWRAMKGPLIGRAFEAWERFLVSRPYDRRIFLSQANRDAPPKRIGAADDVVIEPGIDYSGLSPDKCRKPSVVFAGKLDARKGIHHVLAVARSLPDIPFRVFGWADDISALRALAPANVQIVESKNSNNYHAALSEATIFFFPSYAETFGIVVAEAMAAGCAVVSSVDTISFAGAYVAPGDEAAMISALRRIYDDPVGTAALGEENQRRAARFSWETHIERLLKVYDETLAAHRAKRRHA